MYSVTICLTPLNTIVDLTASWVTVRFSVGRSRSTDHSEGGSELVAATVKAPPLLRGRGYQRRLVIEEELRYQLSVNTHTRTHTDQNSSS